VNVCTGYPNKETVMFLIKWLVIVIWDAIRLSRLEKEIK
jgi:hypothetical protein